MCAGVHEFRLRYPVFSVPCAGIFMLVHTFTFCSMHACMQETLELLEAYGGEEAYEEIKRMVPTYQSCLYPAK